MPDWSDVYASFVLLARCINAIGEFNIVIWREKYLEKETLKEMEKKYMPRKKT